MDKDFNNVHGENTTHVCPECSRQCVECKEKIIKMESKMLKMTIALTSAFTLLGQHAVEYIVDILNKTDKIVEKDVPQDSASSAGKVGYRFDAKKSNQTINFTSHFNPYSDTLQDTEGAKQTFLVDAKKYNSPSAIKGFYSSEWLLSKPKDLNHGYFLTTENTPELVLGNIYMVSKVHDIAELTAAPVMNNIDYSSSASMFQGSINNYNIPNPSTICILAFGGLANMRSRY